VKIATSFITHSKNNIYLHVYYKYGRTIETYHAFGAKWTLLQLIRHQSSRICLFDSYGSLSFINQSEIPSNLLLAAKLQ